MCPDLHDLWYATLQVNTNHTGKFITLHHYISRASLIWWHNVDSNEIMPFTNKDKHFNKMLRKEEVTANVNLFLNYPKKMELRWFRPPDQRDWWIWFECESQEVADHELHITMTTSMLSLIWYRVRSDCSRLSASVHVNDEYYKHKLWNCDFLVYFVRFIDTGFCNQILHKYKHVHSANIAWNVLLLCLRHLHGTVTTKQMCGRKFLHQVLWHPLENLCKINIENLSHL